MSPNTVRPAYPPLTSIDTDLVQTKLGQRLEKSMWLFTHQYLRIYRPLSQKTTTQLSELAHEQKYDTSAEVRIFCGMKLEWLHRTDWTVCVHTDESRNKCLADIIILLLNIRNQREECYRLPL